MMLSIEEIRNNQYRGYPEWVHDSYQAMEQMLITTGISE